MKELLMHGDVLIKPIDSLPNGVKVIEKRLAKGSHITRPDWILAEGEHTGHAHRVVCDDKAAEMYERDGVLYLKVNEAVEVSHEEHHTKPIRPGLYEIGYQREFDYLTQMERQVMD